MLEEVDYAVSPTGCLLLRGRRSPILPEGLVWDVRFAADPPPAVGLDRAEQLAAALALARVAARPCDVLIAGLGVGAAAAVAACDGIGRLDLVESARAVITGGGSPAGEDPVPGDNVASPRRSYDVVLLNADPPGGRESDRWGDDALYGPSALVRADGVLGLWSCDEPRRGLLRLFVERLGGGRVTVHEIRSRRPHAPKKYSRWLVVAEIAA